MIDVKKEKVSTNVNFKRSGVSHIAIFKNIGLESIFKRHFIHGSNIKITHVSLLEVFLKNGGQKYFVVDPEAVAIKEVNINDLNDELKEDPHAFHQKYMMQTVAAL